LKCHTFQNSRILFVVFQSLCCYKGWSIEGAFTLSKKIVSFEAFASCGSMITYLALRGGQLEELVINCP
jgi:hypothetical protein